MYDALVSVQLIDTWAAHPHVRFGERLWRTYLPDVDPVVDERMRAFELEVRDRYFGENASSDGAGEEDAAGRRFCRLGRLFVFVFWFFCSALSLPSSAVWLKMIRPFFVN